MTTENKQTPAASVGDAGDKRGQGGGLFVIPKRRLGLAPGGLLPHGMVLTDHGRAECDPGPRAAVAPPAERLALLLACARGWEMRTECGDTFAYHIDTGLMLVPWGASGIGVSLRAESLTVGKCYHSGGDLNDAMRAVLDPIIAALTAARDAAGESK